MKLERLLGIVVYLLNREVVSANQLAEKFEVSVRTIQRDIDSINLAGIPVTAVQGKNGGYGILDSFKLNKQAATAEDYRFMITALTGMKTAHPNKKIAVTLEKYQSMFRQARTVSSSIQLDFGVSREGSDIDAYLEIIETAIQHKQAITFEYTNTYGDLTLRETEPIGVIYKWYAWYMLGYCMDKKDYRLFKVARMGNVKNSERFFSKIHESFERLLQSQEEQDHREYMNVELLCSARLRVSVAEYFPNAVISEADAGQIRICFRIPKHERGWKGLLYTFGNQIQIVGPEELRQEFLKKAEEIIAAYS
ncbi:YafY family protein [Paenibacillus sp. NFR01]|uniref:helix-turn-helix transcriptional regulator n=1 Tax=Paenibacillus sp. NFR01 TaxID=1566279 RepID=UPI0008C06006|nr:YafY family protein [Paenibacillus sp. NFR01]SET27309.1 Predicted DNA-binding transcriptional regulator YafY, contains an HTH and WYL domains [Paenibacillus sp. NFR01]